MTVPPSTFVTADGLRLEYELDVPASPRAGFVLCHPHPLHGGSMRSVVVGSLFQAMPARGLAVLRFNFRGVEGSEGEHGAGALERLDVAAALHALRAALPEGTPIGLAGWSFGADVALSVGDGHDGWFLVAPPLTYSAEKGVVAGDARPKLVALAQHDQFRAPAEVQAEAATWVNTRVEVVGGADHYFIGRAERLAELADDLAGRLAI